MSFADLGLRAELLSPLTDAGYTIPTPVQAQAIPFILQGRDVLAGAQTGTGKTAAFALPLLQRLSEGPKRPDRSFRPVRCLILTPTRELAAQVEESVREYGKRLTLQSTVIFGGVNINPQIQALRRGADILVATPGRLLDHIQQHTVDLSRVEILVLDEADRMLDMGFIRDVQRILGYLPRQRQNLLFSATFSEEIKRLADGLLHNPALVEVARQNAESELVTQSAYAVAPENKLSLLVYLLAEEKIEQALIFTRTKHGADRLSKQLAQYGVSSVPIHGNRSQPQRTRALADFKSGAVRIMVATDIAARGLDIEQLPHVINFELPNVPEDYVHRIGRTGRAGSPGDAISLVSHDERKYLMDIEKLMKKRVEMREAKGFIAPPPAPRPFLVESPNQGPRQTPRPRPQGPNNGPRPARPGQNSGRPAQFGSGAGPRSPYKR